MSKNDITGDSLVSKPSTEAYRNNFDSIFGKKDMIRNHPRNDLVNPPGQVVNQVGSPTVNPVHQVKPAAKEIADYQQQQKTPYEIGYKQGYLDGFEKGRQSMVVLDHGSEGAR